MYQRICSKDAEAEISTSLYDVLSAKQMHLSRAAQPLHAEPMPSQIANAPGLKPSVSCLFGEQQIFLPNRTPVENARTHDSSAAYDRLPKSKVVTE